MSRKSCKKIVVRQEVGVLLMRQRRNLLEIEALRTPFMRRSASSYMVDPSRCTKLGRLLAQELVLAQVLGLVGARLHASSCMVVPSMCTKWDQPQAQQQVPLWRLEEVRALGWVLVLRAQYACMVDPSMCTK